MKCDPYGIDVLNWLAWKSKGDALDAIVAGHRADPRAISRVRHRSRSLDRVSVNLHAGPPGNAMRKYRLLTGIIATAGLTAATLAGCVSSHVMVGAARPPISADQVKIYLRPPATRYEEIAILNTSSRDSLTFTAQGKTNKVIERLKEEAAKLGANGVLLHSVEDRAAGSVGVGIGSGSISGNSAFGLGLGSSAVMIQKSGSGMAIYVEPGAAPAHQ